MIGSVDVSLMTEHMTFLFFMHPIIEDCGAHAHAQSPLHEHAVLHFTCRGTVGEDSWTKEVPHKTDCSTARQSVLPVQTSVCAILMHHISLH